MSTAARQLNTNELEQRVKDMYEEVAVIAKPHHGRAIAFAVAASMSDGRPLPSTP